MDNIKIPLLKKDDINGIVYAFVGNLINFIIVAFALKNIGWSDQLVYKRVMPGMAVGLMAGSLAYSYLGYKLAKKTNRTDVTALPSGISTTAMFVYLFGVIYPLHYSGLSPELTWTAAVSACFLGGFIEFLGGFIGPFVRRIIPRVAMLATVAGIGLVWMATVGLFEVYHDPILGMPVLIIALIGLIGGYVFKKKIPMLLIAVVFGVVYAFALNRVNVDVSTVSITIPRFALLSVISGFKLIVPYLGIIIPIEVYNFIETMDNVETAIAAGDEYNVGNTQKIDGICTMISALFGGIVPNTVWLGHPGLKKSKTGIGYSWFTGVLFALCAFFGLYGFFNSLMPAVIASITFLWCALIMFVQAFADTPRRHGAAFGIALVPHIADVIYTYVRDALGAHGVYLEETLTMNSTDAVSEKMIEYGVLWRGVVAMRHGAIITGIIWASIMVFIIDRKLDKAGHVLIIASVFSLFGFIHSPVMGFGANLLSFPFAIAYFIVAIMCYVLHFTQKKIMDVPKRFDYV